MSSFEFLKGNIEIIILNSLYSADRYGYEITKEIKEKTENAYEIKQPTLYSYLKRLEGEGLMRSYWGEESSGGRRKYYAITEKGRELCDTFTAEWKYQKSVLDTLVTDSEVKPTSQEEATTLFGSKTKKPRARKAPALNEQESISSKLQQLGEAKTRPSTEETPLSNYVDGNESAAQQSNDLDSSSIADDELEGQYYQPSTDIEGFFDRFNKKAEEIISKRGIVDTTTLHTTECSPINEAATDAQQDDGAYGAGNYKHVLGSVFKNQFEDEALHSAPQETLKQEVAITATTPQTLDKLTDSFAIQGVRLRQYNPESSAYVPRTMLSKNKLMFVAMWLTFLTFTVEAVLIWLIGRPALPILTPCIYLICALLVPIAISVIYFINPTKKSVPDFDFKYHFVNALISSGLVMVLAFSLFVLFAQMFSDTVAVLTWIVLPIVFGINAPTYVLYYKLLFKKMLV